MSLNPLISWPVFTGLEHHGHRFTGQVVPARHLLWHTIFLVLLLTFDFNGALAAGFRPLAFVLRDEVEAVVSEETGNLSVCFTVQRQDFQRRHQHVGSTINIIVVSSVQNGLELHLICLSLAISWDLAWRHAIMEFFCIRQVLEVPFYQSLLKRCQIYFLLQRLHHSFSFFLLAEAHQRFFDIQQRAFQNSHRVWYLLDSWIIFISLLLALACHYLFVSILVNFNWAPVHTEYLEGLFFGQQRSLFEVTNFVFLNLLLPLTTDLWLHVLEVDLLLTGHEIFKLVKARSTRGLLRERGTHFDSLVGGN